MMPLLPHGSVRAATGRPDFNYIRSLYEAAMPALLEHDGWVDPYWLSPEWHRIFTPIESQMWSLIRSQRVPFYPQLPVGRYFVDFGNPSHRIAIECDGRQWHDEERDSARDVAMQAMGWRVVRFSGKTCFTLPMLPDLVYLDGHRVAANTECWVPRLLSIMEEDAA